MSSVIKPEKSGGTSADNSGKEEGFLAFDELLKESTDSESKGIVQSPFKAREENRLARKQSEIIIEQARLEGVRLKEEAVKQGIEEGKLKVKQDTAELMQQYADVLTQIKAQRTVLQEKYEKDIITLVKTMVEQLTNHEVSVNERVIQVCLQKAMEFVVNRSEVKVHLHPEDFQRIKAAGLEDPSLLEGKSQVHIVEDPTTSMGGCFLESNFGEVDATLENRRELLYLALDEAFRDAQAVEGASPP